MLKHPTLVDKDFKDLLNELNNLPWSHKKKFPNPKFRNLKDLLRDQDIKEGPGVYELFLKIENRFVPLLFGESKNALSRMNTLVLYDYGGVRSGRNNNEKRKDVSINLERCFYRFLSSDSKEDAVKVDNKFKKLNKIHFELFNKGYHIHHEIYGVKPNKYDWNWK